MTLLGGYGTCVIWMEGGACGEWEWDGGGNPGVRHWYDSHWQWRKSDCAQVVK